VLLDVGYVSGHGFQILNIKLIQLQQDKSVFLKGVLTRKVEWVKNDLEKKGSFVKRDEERRECGLNIVRSFHDQANRQAFETLRTDD